MSKLKFGIMGAGGIAAHFVNAVRLTDCAEVVAVASKDKRRADDFGRRFGIDGCSYNTLLARDDVDAVYIATTHNFHFENILACLNSGKHVLCEKAMVMHEKDAVAAFSLAREKGLFLMEAMWSRFLPSMVKAREWILEGRIGKLKSVTGVIAFRGSDDPTSRILNPDLGGGAMYDIGVYATEITTYLVGEPVEGVTGNVRRDSRTGVDTEVTFILRFPSVDAMLQCMVTANAKEYIIVNGDRGFIEIPTANVGCESFLYDENRALSEHYRQEFPRGNGFVYEIQETVNCIRRGLTESPVMPASATIECARVFDTLLGS